MKKLLLLFILGGCAAAATAQNLIPNPGFDQKTACPDNTGQIAKAVSWNSYTQSTPDYYNSCDVTYNFGIPGNLWGTQAQQTAAPQQAYAGIFTRFIGDPNYKEYLHARIPALQPGMVYEMSINVSLGDNSNIATDGLGVHFFVAGDSARNNMDPIYITPKVSYNSYGVITNSSGWTKLTKLFTADSAYTHIVIGCFTNDSLLNTVNITTPTQNMSYYYIDDVELKLAPVGIANAELLMNSIRLYPNPSAGQLNITLPQAMTANASLTVYNTVGQKLFETNMGAGTNAVTLPGTMSSGIYMAQIKTEAGVRTMPFALQR